MSVRHIFVVLAMVGFSSVSASGQVVDIRQIGGKHVACLHTGFSSDSDCGTRSYWYSYVFVGSVRAVKPSGDEMELQIVPEEVFLGKPDTPVTVLTSQGLCLPPLKVGDRWLFYLRRVKDKPIIMDYYANDSVPIGQAAERVQTLRRLSQIGDNGVLRGTVMRGNSFEGQPISHAQVFATRKTDKKLFATASQADGSYEFPPLPSGDYKISVGATGPHQPDDSEVFMKAGSCRDLPLTRSPHAEISGTVSRPDGTPVKKIYVALITNGNDFYETKETDSDGHFTFWSLAPGKFVVGLNFPARSDWGRDGYGGSGEGIKLPPVSLFYPNSPQRLGAKVIQVNEDEKVDHIDFVVLAP